MARPRMGLFHMGVAGMRNLSLLLKSFRADQRGVFGVIFALMAVVLVALSGAVVDFVSLQQTRTRAQVALDAAALALQSRVFDTPLNPTDIKAKALALMIERVNDSKVTITMDAPTISVTDGSLLLVAHMEMPTSFVSLVGVTKMSAAVFSQATRKKLALEVAFVLDNSNSMSTSSRMTNLIAATKCAANILFNSDCNSTATTASVADTKLAIVPFTMLVNVGTGKANASWMDRTGSNNITSDNFDDDDNEATSFSGPVDRIALFGKMTNASWGGCVEDRKTPYDTDDTVPSSGQPNTMFTPLFAPDEPGPATTAGYYSSAGSFLNSYLDDSPASCQLRTCVNVQTKTKCNSGASNSGGSSSYSGTCSGTTNDTYSYTSPSGAVSTPSSCASTIDGHAGSYSDSYSNNYVNSTNKYTNTRTRTWTYPLTSRELQERMCKYTGATMNTPDQGYAHGPNSDCPVNAIQPLTSTKSLVTTAINALDPQGGTNIHAGAEWGWRVLSPTEPFTEGASYSTATSKVMIIMTDGENTAYQLGNMNNSSFYSTYGYPWNGRMGTASSTNAALVTEMNARTKTTCTNAKAAGVTIYTVGLAVDQSSAPATNTQLLKDCSSGDGYWYFPASSSDLTSVFTKIANQLSSLRLAQ